MSTETSSTESKGLGINLVQVLAYALAAIAAAVLGSFFGFSGTVIGAGVASVISTVGAAVFQRGAEKTSEAAKRAARNTGALRMQQGTGKQQSQQNQQQPRPTQYQQQQGPSTLQRNQPGRATTSRAYRPVDPTEQIADLATPLHEQRTRYSAPAGTSNQRPVSQQPTQYTTGHRPPAEPEPDTPGQPWWRRRIKLLIGMFVLLFVIGIAGVSAIEALSGGPLSGGKGGTSIGRMVSGDSANQDQRNQDGQQGGQTTDTPRTDTTETGTTETTTEQPTEEPTEETGQNEPKQPEETGQNEYQNDSPQGKNAPRETGQNEAAATATGEVGN